MAILTYASKTEVPEDLAEYAKEQEGKWVVNVAPKAKLDDFRDKNIEAFKERDRYKEQIEAFAAIGNDPTKLKDELTKLREQDQLVKDGKLKTSDDIQKRIDDAVKAKETSWKQQIDDATAKAETATRAAIDATSKYRDGILVQRITNAVLAEDSNINPTALPDILARARSIYSVTDDEKLVAKKGDSVVYGADGDPMQPKEWLTKVLVEAPYLGKSSTGGGATGSEDRAFAGMSREAFGKLSPEERMTRHRAAAAGKR